MTFRICVITQSAAFAASAGMRIRYDRFREGSVGLDVTIVAQPIDAIVGKPFDHDVYIFCKTFTPEALILAALLRQHGRIVGQDFFDDYFSQRSDQRLFQYRAWLRQMAPMTDFAICTTPRMRAVLQPYLPHCAITIVEDPVIGYDASRVAVLTDRKIARARAQRHLRIAWFGIGDNPFFPVGLDDLTSPAALTALGRLRAAGWAITLTIATNMRALDKTGLARLRALPVPIALTEWSEAEERAVLIDADIALLPVGGQAFSRAKSLNRALTAMEQGCQVLSLGEPLYAPLDAHLYRSSAELDADYHSGDLRLRAETATILAQHLQSIADVYASAGAFTTAARDARPSAPAPAGPLAVVHGRGTSIDLHKLVVGNRGFSIRSPYTQKRWNFGIRFDLEDGALKAHALPDIVDQYRIPILSGIGMTEYEGVRFHRLDLDMAGLAIASGLVAIDETLLFSLASYPRVMGEIVRICRHLFPDRTTLLVDTAPTLPAVPGVTA